MWLPTAVADQSKLYGAEESEPTGMPSTSNSTDVTPVSSEAVAVTVTGPYTEAPSAGEVIAAVGAVVSGATAVTCTSAEVPVLPAASWATVRNVCGPAVAVQLKV